MIEVLILIAVALIGILLVLGRISLTLKEILEAMVEHGGLGTLKSPSTGKAAVGAFNLSTMNPQNDLAAQGAQMPKSTSEENRTAADTLQDIAAVVAIADRARRQGFSEPRAS